MKHILQIIPLLLFHTVLFVSCDTLNEFANTNKLGQESNTRTVSSSQSKSTVKLDPTKQKLLFKYLMDGDLEGVKKQRV